MTSVGVLWRTRNITIISFLQWDANKWTDILEFRFYLLLCSRPIGRWYGWRFARRRIRRSTCGSPYLVVIFAWHFAAISQKFCSLFLFNMKGGNPVKGVISHKRNDLIFSLESWVGQQLLQNSLNLYIHQLHKSPKQFDNSVSKKCFIRSSSRLGNILDHIHIHSLINLRTGSRALRQERSPWAKSRQVSQWAKPVRGLASLTDSHFVRSPVALPVPPMTRSCSLTIKAFTEFSI